MARPSNYPTLASFRWMSIPAIAKEIGRTPRQTEKLLKKMGFIGLKPRRFSGTKKYPAAAVETLKAMLDQPHRPGRQSGGDWLSAYEKETT